MSSLASSIVTMTNLLPNLLPSATNTPIFIESCLVSHYLLIHKQGRDRLNPTYSEGRSHSFLLCEGSASSKR
ncbi:hypothetical protein QUB08_30990 [Microcoleus sp. BR0-C5]|uniref:hypothetical protein n=1 Tax=Microcoleus sp. BR0-C5 TaxID=2818713 RepID=UPI002FD17A5C